MEFLKAKWIFSIAALMLFEAGVPVPVTAAEARAPEYQVKAAMLFKFALFVEWPAKAFSTANSPFVFCLLGKDPFGPWLRHEIDEMQVGARRSEIRRLEKVEDAGECHIVFISRSERPVLRQVLAQFRDTSALIVSDINDTNEFCRYGGIVGFVTEGGKVRFELNSKSAMQKGLKMDSRLKRIAKSVECGDRQ